MINYKRIAFFAIRFFILSNQRLGGTVMSENVIIYNVKLPKHVKKEIKLLAIEKNFTQGQLLEWLVKKELSKDPELSSVASR